MASRVYAFSAYDLNGAPLSGLAPSFSAYVDAVTGNAITPPAIAEIGTSGIYKFTVTLTSAQVLAFRLDFGANASPRYYDDVIGYNELLVPGTDASIDAQLSGTHGSGNWGGSGGSGSQSVTITATIGGVAQPGAFVCAYAGSTLMASGNTGADGKITFLLNPGTYNIRVTQTGYQWTATDAVVSSPNAISPSSFDGTGTAPTGTSATGLSGTSTVGAPNLSGSITELVAGDDYTLTRTIAAVPAGETLTKAWLTVKATQDDLGVDTLAIFQKTITAVSGPDGQITNTGAGGTGAVSFALSAANTLALSQTYDYDIQVLTSGGHVRTVEKGTISPVSGVTTSVA